MHLFYQPDDSRFELDEEEARHAAKVLRLASGDIIYVTNGRGALRKCILNVHGKSTKYEVVESTMKERRGFSVEVAVAPTRKAERNEWMVEKMVEIGVERIDFLITEHTQLETINRVVNLSRLTRIAAAAMKQSQQYYMPEITVSNKFQSFVKEASHEARMIAYVPAQHEVEHLFTKVQKNSRNLLLIGPEGDFTESEVALAMECGFSMVSLGPTRLRTETAAVAGCLAMNLAQTV